MEDEEYSVVEEGGEVERQYNRWVGPEEGQATNEQVYRLIELLMRAGLSVIEDGDLRPDMEGINGWVGLQVYGALVPTPPGDLKVRELAKLIEKAKVLAKVKEAEDSQKVPTKKSGFFEKVFKGKGL